MLKHRGFWLVLVVAALAVGGVWLLRKKSATSASSSPAAAPIPADLARPATHQAAPAKPKVEPVPIEEGKTIDFSSGLPLVNDSAKQKAIIDRSVKAMEDAARDVTFGSPATAADTKKAEPSPTPPPPK